MILSRHYQKITRLGKHHLIQRPYIIPLMGLVLGLGIAAAIWVSRSSSHVFRPSEAKIVYVFDRGKRRILDTRAKTVGELIDRLNLHLIPQDVVEPSRNTPIVEDNFRINVYHARPVTVLDGSQRIVTLTAQRSPRVVAANAGLKINPEDIATFTQGDLKQNIIGEQVEVARATPITLNLYGTQVATYTQAKTVASMMDEKHIKLNNGESVNPATSTAITPNLQIFILAKGAQVVTVEETIPIPTQTVDDASLSFGTTVVRQNGNPGKKLVTYLVTTQAGGQASRKPIQEAIVEAAVPQIIAKGTTININGDKTAVMAASGISSSDYGYVNYIVSRESNWNPYSRNASGCLGLGQACPGSKLTNVCPNLDPVCQLRYFSGYASRYGGWGGAYSFWAGHGYW